MIAFNGKGDPASILSTAASPFNFVGAYLTAAWSDGLSAEVKGFKNFVQVYDTTVHPIATTPTKPGISEIEASLTEIRLWPTCGPWSKPT